MSVTIRSVLQEAIYKLSSLSDDPRLEATALLAHCMEQPRSYLLAHDEEKLPRKAAKAFAKLLKRRCKGEPYAYVIGRREFWSIDLEVSPKVLIPRPDTESLVEAALKHIPRELPCLIADLGTGSGAIALAIAKERPLSNIIATDISASALSIAQANGERLAPGRVEFKKGDWLDCLEGERFDVIVSNPPYVAARDPHLADLPFEPKKALVAGADGLDELSRLIPDAPEHLRKGGWLLVEHGSDQGEQVRALFTAAGFGQVTTRFDLGGNERVTQGQFV